MPGAGSLRDRINILRRSKVSNGRGGFVDKEIEIATDIPAQIEVKRGSEQFQAQRLSGVTPHEIVVRHDTTTATISARDVAVDQHGTRYAIQWAGCLDVGRKRWITISATTGEVADR